mmetsp:Transcript_21088/g.39637  ORF Transcript_21088/g.39637 Transcript_21088/m.39637 type:complete len:125 (-) Transcript_21088:261-635(-)
MASNALAPISRLMARVWGNTGENPMHAKVAFTKPKDSQNSKESKDSLKEEDKQEEKTAPERAEKARRPREVRIDSMTMVPTDLYWNLLREGERAKNAGQHRLKDTRSSRGTFYESPRPHLVRTN